MANSPPPKFESNFKVNYIFTLLSLCLLTFIFTTITAHAQALCDADIEAQIKNNALMQAHRKVVAAESMINKPDSLLEMSCFDQRLKFVANNLAENFSNSDTWRNTTMTTRNGGYEDENDPVRRLVKSRHRFSVYMGENHLDRIIDRMVTRGIERYIDRNYDHNLLGGNLATDYDFERYVDDAGNVCDVMRNVFYQAKCADFSLYPGLMDMGEFSSDDPRRQPEECRRFHNLTANLVELASNNENINFDRLENTYLDTILAGEGGNCEASTPISTGVKVKYNIFESDIAGLKNLIDFIGYDEKFCLNPGCFYVPPDTCRAN